MTIKNARQAMILSIENRAYSVITITPTLRNLLCMVESYADVGKNEFWFNCPVGVNCSGFLRRNLETLKNRGFTVNTYSGNPNKGGDLRPSYRIIWGDLTR